MTQTVFGAGKYELECYDGAKIQVQPVVANSFLVIRNLIEQNNLVLPRDGEKVVINLNSYPLCTKKNLKSLCEFAEKSFKGSIGKQTKSFRKKEKILAKKYMSEKYVSCVKKVVLANYLQMNNALIKPLVKYLKFLELDHWDYKKIKKEKLIIPKDLLKDLIKIRGLIWSKKKNYVWEPKKFLLSQEAFDALDQKTAFDVLYCLKTSSNRDKVDDDSPYYDDHKHHMVVYNSLPKKIQKNIPDFCFDI